MVKGLDTYDNGVVIGLTRSKYHRHWCSYCQSYRHRGLGSGDRAGLGLRDHRVLGLFF